MSDTPETDQIEKYDGFKMKDSVTTCGDESSSVYINVIHARQLERERDDAREKAERYRFEANATMMQRDEARSELSLKQQTLTIAEGTLSDLRKQRDEWSAMCGRYKQERDIAEDERIDMAQQLESEKQCHDRCQNERDALIQKLDAWEEIAEHLHHFVQYPAWGVDQATQRMDVLEAYKHLKK